VKGSQHSAGHARQGHQIPLQKAVEAIVNIQSHIAYRFVDLNSSHPDKVKATANLTIEAIQEHFVMLTKAYKS